MKLNEVWKPIPNFEGLYEVSNLGRVKALKRKKNCNRGFGWIKEHIMNYIDYNVSNDFIEDRIAFENHLNVFHINKSSLSENIAYGLIVWLNSTYIDEKFRLFSGHAQVNATDLRNLPYPNVEDLEKLGKQLKSEKNWNQNIFDKLSKAVTK